MSSKKTDNEQTVTDATETHAKSMISCFYTSLSAL